MAIDMARVKLELASGRNQITAPFVHAAQRKRSKPEDAAPTETIEQPQAAAQVIAAVPLAAVEALVEAPAIAPAIVERPGAGRPPWIAVIAALIVVAATVWWIMSQRLPAIDPQVVIQRNLDEARQAMAAGHYTHPVERSAFHYYNTVLALDPSNAAAVSGIDAIADRHITDARVLLSQQRIAEAGVALDQARRVRPNHSGLAALDVQFRGELRKMLIASTAASQAASAASVTKPTTKATDAAAAARLATIRRNSEAAKRATTAAALPAPAPEDATALAGSAPESMSSEAINGAPGAGANIDHSPAAPAASSPLPERAPDPMVHANELKLIKMIQPEYPQEALMRGIEGWVDVSLQVTAAGDVIQPRVEDTSRGRLFNRAALAAVQQWKYEPRGEGAPTERVQVRLRFQQSN